MQKHMLHSEHAALCYIEAERRERLKARRAKRMRSTSTAVRMKFGDWWRQSAFAESHPDLYGICEAVWLASESYAVPEERAKIIQECRTAVLETGQQAHEAAKAKDATDYIAGYQDCAVDADEALRDLLTPSPQSDRP